MTALAVVAFVLAPPLVLVLILFAMRREFEGRLLEIGLVAAAVALFFHRVLFFREALSQADANLLQLRFFMVYREAIRGFAQLPFWSPWEGAGVPNLAHPLSAMFYPLAPIVLVGNVFKAFDVLVVAHYFLAGVFALALGRRVFATRPGAFAFAVLYALNGWAVTRAAQQPAIEYMFAYAWLPLAALAFERAIDDGRVLAPSPPPARQSPGWA